MEHQLLPAWPTSTLPKVPYVCAPRGVDGKFQPYDGGPFLTYPARVGKEWMVSDDSYESRSERKLHQRSRFQSVEEQQSFLQAWLFFGLLSRFLQSVYQAEHFISVEPDGVFITTARLLEKMHEAWQTRSANATVEEKMVQVQNAMACLRVIPDVLEGCYDGFDWRISTSIASVMELFARSVYTAFANTGATAKNYAPPIFSYLFPTPQVTSAMVESGWCPSEVRAMRDRFTALQAMIFLSQLDKRSRALDHSRCSDNFCKCYQICLQEYRTAHVQPHCDCEPLGADIDEICRILETNSLPILELSNISAETPTIRVVPASESRPYVALSHVWADGLGNPFANELPTCQVRAIGNLLISLQRMLVLSGKSTTTKSADLSLEMAQRLKFQDEGKTYLWVDTLCCPVSSASVHGKETSILRMRETYSHAAQVLVLDRELYSTKFAEITKIEALLRVFNAAWLRRLWTLQEGALPRSVWIQFQDQAVDLDNLFRELLLENRRDVRVMAIFDDVSAAYQGLRRLEHLKQDGDKSIRMLLSNIQWAFHDRSVSVPEDEPICLGNLLGLDPGLLRDVPATAEARMAKVWKALATKYDGLPRQMVLLNYPRMQTAGFRWAPRTLLRTGPGPQKFAWNDPVMGKVNDEGFHIIYPGVNLKLHQVEGDLETHRSIVHNRLNIPISFDIDGVPYTILSDNTFVYSRGITSEYPRHSELFGKNLGIIKVFGIRLDQATKEVTHWLALLGEVACASNGCRKFSTICPVYLEKNPYMFGPMFAAIKQIMLNVNLERHQTDSISAEHDQSRKMDRKEAGETDAMNQIAFERASEDRPKRHVRAKSGDLSLADFPPIPFIIESHSRFELLQRPALRETMSLLYFTHEFDKMVKMLAYMTWVSLRYRAEATLTNDDQLWTLV